MLSKPTLLLSCLVALPCLAAAAALPQDPERILGELVTRAVADSADRPVEELWRRAAALGDAARLRVRSAFSPEAELRRYRRLYGALRAGARRRPAAGRGSAPR